MDCSTSTHFVEVTAGRPDTIAGSTHDCILIFSRLFHQVPAVQILLQKEETRKY